VKKDRFSANLGHNMHITVTVVALLDTFASIAEACEAINLIYT